MDIYFNTTTLNISVNDNSYRYRAIMGEHSLTLYYSLPEYIEIPVGAYCVFENETYTLETPENFKMHNSRNFEYTLIMESAQAKLKKYKLRNIADKRLKFEITCRPKEHLQMLVDNLNKRESGWIVGECIDAAEKMIAYNHASCDAALSQIAEAFETEWEVVGKTINLRKVEYNKDKKDTLNNGYDGNGDPIPLAYGRGKGFKPGIGRANFSDSKPVEVLFVQGGEKNIDADKYKSKELLLPKGQTLRYDGKFFEGQVGFNTSIARTYVSDADGLSIQRQDKPLRSKEEDSLDLSEIYPSRVGEVSSVITTKKGFCDITDTSIPDDLDFKEYRVGNEAVAIIFQSGILAGKEFDANYIHADRRFEIIEEIIDTIPMPKGDYMPVVGDKYAVFNILLPKNYVTEASWDMFKQAVKYLYENEEQRFTFTGELDGIWAKKDWLNIGGKIKLGGYVLFSDNQFQPDGIGIRIVGIKDYINNPHSPEIELSNSVVGSSIMSDIRKIESNEVLTDSQHKEALQFTKRRFRDAQETSAMLENALLENFSKSINPISIRTMQLLLGDKSLQFCFVNNKTKPTTITHEVIYNQDTKVLTAQAGILQHLTIGINTLSSSHKANEYSYWDIAAFTSPTLTESSKSYYLYAKVSTENAAGVFYLTEQAIEMEQEAGCYHLLYGILNSEYNNERSFAPMYGFAELTPGRLTISMIASPGKEAYFNVAKGEIGGRIVFKSMSGEDKTINELEAFTAADATAKADAARDEAIRSAQIDADDKVTNFKETIIDGNFIRTSKIKADELVVRNVKTSENGARVEIMGSPNNRIAIYQNTKTLVTDLSGIRYTSLASLLSTTSLPNRTFTGVANQTHTYTSGKSTLSSTFTLATIPGVTSGSWSMSIPSYTINLFIRLNRDGSRSNMGRLEARVYFDKTLIGSADANTDNNSASVNVSSMEIPASATAKNITLEIYGTYDTRMMGTGIEAPVTLEYSLIKDNPAANIVFIEIAKITKLFANGLMSKYSTNKYFAVIDSIGDPLVSARGNQTYMSGNGMFRIRIDDAGVWAEKNMGQGSWSGSKLTAD